ncbi:hypothetical protein AOQ84DRAFT_28830 [Glonium stellatum]|uniref:Uncharacterized protein n=1 Tax=Glonium stellatum TaxID=574774 RepID=A0A8E2F2H5_9PEZI|nr:hypothetical protein AOQ84DRAFT_28830 [Glonium stellatum]
MAARTLKWVLLNLALEASPIFPIPPFPGGSMCVSLSNQRFSPHPRALQSVHVADVFITPKAKRFPRRQGHLTFFFGFIKRVGLGRGKTTKGKERGGNAFGRGRTYTSFSRMRALAHSLSPLMHLSPAHVFLFLFLSLPLLVRSSDMHTVWVSSSLPFL